MENQRNYYSLEKDAVDKLHDLVGSEVPSSSYEMVLIYAQKLLHVVISPCGDNLEMRLYFDDEGSPVIVRLDFELGVIEDVSGRNWQACNVADFLCNYILMH